LQKTVPKKIQTEGEKAKAPKDIKLGKKEEGSGAGSSLGGRIKGKERRSGHPAVSPHQPTKLSHKGAPCPEKRVSEEGLGSWWEKES